MDEDYERLLNYIREFNIYDLERLKTCFEYELTIEPENKERIEQILNCINISIAEKQ